MKHKIARCVVIGVASALFCSCASDPAPGSSSREDPLLPVIGHLELRDHLVTILSSTNGPVYTITTKDGRSVAVQLGMNELQARFPDLHERIKTSVAAGDARF